MQLSHTMLLLLFSCLCSVKALSDAYSSITNVVSLSSKTFNETAKYGRWLILFYRHSCGGCKVFIPKFKKIANSLETWKPLLNLGVIDCELELNRLLCIKFDISSVPTLRYFPSVHSVRQHKPEMVNIGDITYIKKQILEFLANDISDNPKDPSYQKLVAIRNALDEDKKTNENSQQLKKEDKQEKTVRSAKKMDSKVYADDIFRSLSVLFYYDISMFSEIVDEELGALRMFLSMLTKVLPCSVQYREKLTQLLVWVEGSSKITGKEWAEKLDKIEFPNFTGSYIACNGSNPSFRGYPCGLWILFHSLTVRHYELTKTDPDLPRNLVARALARFVPRFFSCLVCSFHFAANTANLVLPGESYLPRNRDSLPEDQFKWNQSIIASLPTAPKSARDEVLWLNIVHNRVNQRLAGSITEDPTAPKMQFPTREMCPLCWTHSGDGNWTLGQTPETEHQLFQFLLKHYGSASWLTVNVDSAFFSKSEPSYPLNYYLLYFHSKLFANRPCEHE